MNMSGYSEMRNIGATQLIPSPLEYVEIDSIPVIIMQDCGSDFWHAVRERQKPVEMYLKLVEELKKYTPTQL